MSKTIESNRDWEQYWNDVPTSGQSLYKQVGRTVGGTPTPPEQLELTVKAVARGLDIKSEDILLDLCCGNGLVTARLAELCKAVIGVDYSTALINVANEQSAAPHITYVQGRADALTPSDFVSGPPTKICLNAALQHFTAADTTQLLQSLRRILPVTVPIYLTDVPDVEKLRAFYNTPERWAQFERGRATGSEAIGTWWDRSHLVSLFDAEGYQARVLDIEAERHTAHYRFDVIAFPRD